MDPLVQFLHLRPPMKSSDPFLRIPDLPPPTKSWDRALRSQTQTERRSLDPFLRTRSLQSRRQSLHHCPP